MDKIEYFYAIKNDKDKYVCGFNELGKVTFESESVLDFIYMFVEDFGYDFKFLKTKTWCKGVIKHNLLKSCKVVKVKLEEMRNEG